MENYPDTPLGESYREFKDTPSLHEVVLNHFKKEVNMLTLKDHVSGNVEFQYYRAGNLMYKTSTGLEFPVPTSDTNDASFPRTEKGLLFMRWIRKHLDTIK